AGPPALALARRSEDGLDDVLRRGAAEEEARPARLVRRPDPALERQRERAEGQSDELVPAIEGLDIFEFRAERRVRQPDGEREAPPLDGPERVDEGADVRARPADGQAGIAPGARQDRDRPVGTG